MQSDTPGWIGICMWSRGKLHFVFFFSSCLEENIWNWIPNLSKRMNGLIFRQCQAQTCFRCFLWRLKTLHRFEQDEGLWAVPGTARDFELISYRHTPRQNAENELWAAKPISKEGFDLMGLLFWYSAELGLTLSHCPRSHSDHREISGSMRDSQGEAGEMSGANSSESGEFYVLLRDVCES